MSPSIHLYQLKKHNFSCVIYNNITFSFTQSEKYKHNINANVDDVP